MARKQNKKVLKLYPNEYYLFICEDKKSMVYYLNGIKHYLKQNIKLDAQHSNNGNTAKEVYECAKSEYEKLYQDKDAYKRGFHVIACFDKDENNIEEIKNIMNKKRAKIIAIYNNPCYEFWLHLHIENNAPIYSSSDECATKCMQEINKKYGKKFKDVQVMKQEKNIFEIVKKDLAQAILNAKSLSLTDYTQTYTNAQVVLENIVDLEKIEK